MTDRPTEDPENREESEKLEAGVNWRESDAVGGLWE
jgi:hypothetical protein